MNITKIEQSASSRSTTAEHLPTTWSDERDVAFFRITTHLFDSAFVDGAGVLLASYDDITD